MILLECLESPADRRCIHVLFSFSGQSRIMGKYCLNTCFFLVVFYVNTVLEFEDLSDLCICDPKCLPQEVGPF